MSISGTTLKELLVTPGSDQIYLSPGLQIGTNAKYKPFLEQVRPRGNTFGFKTTAYFDLPRKQLLSGVSLYFKVATGGGQECTLPNGGASYIKEVRFTHGGFKYMIPGDWITVNTLIDNDYATLSSMYISLGLDTETNRTSTNYSSEYVVKIPAAFWDDAYFPLCCLAEMPAIEVDFREPSIVEVPAGGSVAMTDCGLICQFVNIASAEAETLIKMANEQGGIRIPITEVIHKKTRSLKTADSGEAVEVSLANVSGLVHSIIMTVRDVNKLEKYTHSDFRGYTSAVKIDEFQIFHNNRSLEISNKPISGFLSAANHIPTHFKGCTVGNNDFGFENACIYGVVLSKSGKDSLHNSVMGYQDFFNSASSYMDLTVSGCTDAAPVQVDIYSLRHNVMILNGYNISTLKVSNF